MPVKIDWFMHRVRIGAIECFISFRIMLDIPSWPELDLDLRLPMIFRTSSVETGVKLRRDVICSFKY